MLASIMRFEATSTLIFGLLQRRRRYLLWLLFLLAIPLLWLSACGETSSPEPAAVDDTGPALAAVGQEDAAALPTPGGTLPPPDTPAPLPTTILDPTAALAATRMAALSPPTPAIVGAPVGGPEDAPPSTSILTQPLPTPSGTYSWTLKLPILMYHYISDPPAGADEYRTDLSVSPAAFREQMTYLRDNGYTPVDLYALSTAIVGYSELPDKPVIITFDDGYIDNYDNAFPILQEFGFQGTFFIISEFVDRGREGYMDWGMIEELARAGHRIESHSRTHPNLTEKDHDGLIWEILGAQETIAAHIGYRPRYFCYPGGDYNEATIQVLRDLDYWGAVTTASGSWHGFNNRFEWERLRLHNFTTITDFARLVDLEGTVRGKSPG